MEDGGGRLAWLLLQRLDGDLRRILAGLDEQGLLLLGVAADAVGAHGNVVAVGCDGEGPVWVQDERLWLRLLQHLLLLLLLNDWRSVLSAVDDNGASVGSWHHELRLSLLLLLRSRVGYEKHGAVGARSQERNWSHRLLLLLLLLYLLLRQLLHLLLPLLVDGGEV